MIVDINKPIYSYDDLISDAKALADGYTTLIKYVTIGRSHDNRDIILLKLGWGRKHLLFCAGVHGRESINSIALMGIIEYYAQVYIGYHNSRNVSERRLLYYKPDNSEPAYIEPDCSDEHDKTVLRRCVAELLQTYTILFIPLLNPDGYMAAVSGYDEIRDSALRAAAIKSSIPSYEWKYNARGADINRNFPSRLWKPKFKGDYAASENETKALIYVFHHYRIKIFIDLHSRGNSIYYYRNRMPKIYNDRQLKLAQRLKEITGYSLIPPEEEIEAHDSGGNSVHYFSEHFGRPAITIETVEDEAGLPLDIKYRREVIDTLKPVVFELGSLII